MELTPIRIGYARCSTDEQELQSRLDALGLAECRRMFSEKISTRIKLFAVLAVAAQLDRDYIREKTLTIKVGKNAGKNQSAASLYGVLAEAGETAVVPGPARAPDPGTSGSRYRRGPGT